MRFTLIVAVIIIVQGVMALFGVMTPTQASAMTKYTEESVKKWIRPSGVCSLILAP